MSAEKWMRELEMFEQVRSDLLGRQRTQAAEEERIRQEAERRAWLRELKQPAVAYCQLKGENENGA
jgi:hypothetical protein